MFLLTRSNTSLHFDPTMSCKGPLCAQPMLGSRKCIEKYYQELIDLTKKCKLPNLLANLEYKVYTICGSNIDAHKSVVLSHNDINFFTIELGFYKMSDGETHVKPVTKALDSSLRSKLEFIGTVKTTGAILFEKAVEAMRKFGGYYKFCNNCHDYCNTFLESIGLM